MLLVLPLALALLAACGETASSTVRPSPSPSATDAGPTEGATPRATPRATPAPWPSAWDSEFCAAFTDLAVAQELVVDIPRALEEEATDDALALARELRQTAISAADLLETVPDWEPAQAARNEMAALLDIDGRIGRQYIRFLDEGRRPGLTRARELTEALLPILGAANEALADLADMGLECPPYDLSLESP